MCKEQVVKSVWLFALVLSSFYYVKRGLLSKAASMQAILSIFEHIYLFFLC